MVSSHLELIYLTFAQSSLLIFQSSYSNLKILYSAQTYPNFDTLFQLQVIYLLKQKNMIKYINVQKYQYQQSSTIRILIHTLFSLYILFILISMGLCQSKQKKKNQPKVVIQEEENGVEQKDMPLGLEANQIYDVDKGSMPSIYLNYFKRKYKRECRFLEEPMNLNKFVRYFNYLKLSDETMRQLYCYLTKQDKLITNFHNLKQTIQDIVFLKKQEQVIDMIYEIYFKTDDDIRLKLRLFASEMDSLIQINNNRGKDSPNSLIVSKQEKKQIIQKFQEKIKLKQFNKQHVKQWAKTYLNVRKFMELILIGGFEKDEKLAYIMFTQRDKRPQFQGNTVIISKYWIDKWIKYFSHKYKMSLNRKQSEDIQIQPENRLSSIKSMIKTPKLQKKSSSSALVAPSNTYYRGKKMALLSHINQYKIFKRQDSNINFLYPNEIDNICLAGNYQWELKKNLRCFIDYLPIDEQIYDQLYLVYGGSPKYVRKLIKGCFELNPYNVRIYQFIYKNKQSQHLKFSKHLKVSRDDPIEKVISIILDIFPKQFIILHRNPGSQWKKLKEFIENLKSQYCRVDEVFAQTSFIVLMPEEQYNNFLLYRMRSKVPCVGDMFQDGTSHVCVYEQVEKDYVPYIFLNDNNFFRKMTKLNEFRSKYKENRIVLKSIINPSTQKGGIINLGNTCYLSVSIQGILALRKNDLIFNKNGLIGSQIHSIINIIEKKNKNVFPYHFKTIFEERYNSFCGQNQHDAHQFLSKLIQMLQEESQNQQIQSQLITKIEETKTCVSCQKQSKMIDQIKMLTLHLKDYRKKTVKIDYITNNTLITTVTFEVEEGSTVEDWKEKFQKITNTKANTYLLCQIGNSQILNIFFNPYAPESEILNYEVQNSLFIYAYDLKTYKSKQELNQKFFLFKDGTRNYLTKICKKSKDLKDEDSISSRGTKIKKNIEVYDITIKDREFHKHLQSFDFQLQPYNLKNQENFIELIVSNYDSEYKEKIGFPFIIRLRKTYPLSAVRQAVQSCLSKKSNYFIRLVSYGQLNICQFCRNMHCSGRCFYDEEKNYPIQWFQNIGEYLIVWDSYKHYSRNIKRQSFSHTQENTQLDNFENLYQRFKSPQPIQLLCNYCSKSKFIKQDKIISWAPLLIVHLSRFTIKYGTLSKLHTRWKLEKLLMIDHKQYILKAVILHKGHNIESGHYVAIINGYKYDDELVTPFDTDDIQPQQIYILMYSCTGFSKK